MAEAYRTPAYCLPYELLMEIWKHIRDSGQLQNGVWVTSTFTVSQVCRWWRSAALSTPELWQEVRFSVPVRRAKATDMLRLHLERSGDLPLDIEGRLMCDWRPPHYSWLHTTREGTVFPEDLMAALTKHADRWRTLSIQVDGDFPPCSRMIMHLIDIHLSPLSRPLRTPRLRNVQIQCGEYGQMSFGRGIPQLSRLHLRSILIDLDFTGPTLAHLTALDVGCLPPRLRFLHADFRDILARAPNLARLCLTGPCLQGGSLDYTPIHMPALRELAFNECASDEDEDGFMLELHHVISAPHLSCLTLSGLKYLALCDFLRSLSGGVPSAAQKYPALTRLRLRNVETCDYSDQFTTLSTTSSDATGLQIGRQFASIKHLELENKSCLLLRQLGLLTGRYTADPPLPNLRTLSWLPYRAGDGLTIQDFIARRTRLEVPLNSLQLQKSDHGRVEDYVAEWFRSHVQVDLVDDTKVLHSWQQVCTPWQDSCTCDPTKVHKRRS
ncbi:hypothetical protein OE88DRAFT_1449844 [Heliocybe sulcata]|uniref:Uncharacterized protein n=1 Tax=Heliocybe sulcata TaxID=5364 RepID=A0A5C3N3X2_9AGAM|nr:hypothetical protein OE88DRAFT_1449844 [Heliocybe sulcata]